jgi:hypothetical protein
MRYIVYYDNGYEWLDYYRYNFLIDGDSIKSVRQKIVDAFVEAKSTGHFDMIIDGYLYPMPYLDEEKTVKFLDFEVTTVEDYLKNHMPRKA